MVILDPDELEACTACFQLYERRELTSVGMVWLCQDCIETGAMVVDPDADHL